MTGKDKVFWTAGEFGTDEGGYRNPKCNTAVCHGHSVESTNNARLDCVFSRRVFACARSFSRHTCRCRYLGGSRCSTSCLAARPRSRSRLISQMPNIVVDRGGHGYASDPVAMASRASLLPVFRH